MNSHQAKAIPLSEFLARLSHIPASVRPHELWYRSPFRSDERTPSFKIDIAKNVWYDHGAGQGGTIIDLVQVLYGVSGVSRALAIITEITGESMVPVNLRRRGGGRANIEAGSAKSPPVIDRISRIADPGLESYLLSRSIPPELARLYLSEIHYRIDERPYRALAFENDSGGYELRNPYFKGVIGRKDIRFLATDSAGTLGARFSVFEGVFDFLSALVLSGRDRFEDSVVVLNSVALLRRGVERIRMAARGEVAPKIDAYFDRDKAGQLAFAELSREFQGDARITDRSLDYASSKDLNEHLVARGVHGKAARDTTT